MASIFRGSASRPTTSCPSSAKATASGSPTYPSPTTPTLIGGSVGGRLPGAGWLVALARGLASGRRLGVAELVRADQVVDEEPARGCGGHGDEPVGVDGGQVADHGGGVDADQALEPVDVVGADADRDRAALARHLADRPVGALIGPVWDRRVEDR